MEAKYMTNDCVSCKSVLQSSVLNVDSLQRWTLNIIHVPGKIQHYISARLIHVPGKI